MIQASTKSYIVFVDDNFHFMDEDERYQLGEYETYEAAVRACQAIVDAFLESGLKPGMTASELYAGYQQYGEDPFVIPNDRNFSAWDYAKKRSDEICRSCAIPENR